MHLVSVSDHKFVFYSIGLYSLVCYIQLACAGRDVLLHAVCALSFCARPTSLDVTPCITVEAPKPFWLKCSICDDWSILGTESPREVGAWVLWTRRVSKTLVVWVYLCVAWLSFASFLNRVSAVRRTSCGVPRAGYADVTCFHKLKKKQLEALVETDERDARKERNGKRDRHGRVDQVLELEGRRRAAAATRVMLKFGPSGNRWLSCR